VYDATDALEAKSEALHRMYETTQALFAMRAVLDPGNVDPWPA
jgi:hypothetical protein